MQEMPRITFELDAIHCKFQGVDLIPKVLICHRFGERIILLELFDSLNFTVYVLRHS